MSSSKECQILFSKGIILLFGMLKIEPWASLFPVYNGSIHCSIKNSYLFVFFSQTKNISHATLFWNSSLTLHAGSGAPPQGSSDLHASANSGEVPLL